MSENKRHIELAVVKVDGDQVTFRIAEQTHRGKEFCENGTVFKSGRGVLVVGAETGSEGKNCSISFVSSQTVRACDEKYETSANEFVRIMEAIAEYNETDGRGYEKPWPQKGDKYFCIYPDSTILEWNYTHDCTDEERRKFGNFFRTREEAEAALERVKKALKGEEND